MTHEPECLATYDPSPFFHKPTEPYCSCEAIRAAYQRGREDAVIEMLDVAGDFHTWRELPDHVVESIIAAVRGDGESSE